MLLDVRERIVQHSWGARLVNVRELSRDGPDRYLKQVKIVRMQPIPARDVTPCM